MARIFSKNNQDNKPEIDHNKVLEFFEQRAQKAKKIGYKQAVIYQDKNPELAEKRDLAEKELLLPKLQLSGQERLLDIGCGSGRWSEVLSSLTQYYHGIDSSLGLLDIARTNFTQANTKYTCIKANELSLKALNENVLFERVCCFGVLIYLNELELDNTFKGVAEVTAPNGIFLLREPTGVDCRLTIQNHFSDDMEQTYNAIYRTEQELLDKAEKNLYPWGFKLISCGDVFENIDLNNRTETKQRYYLFKKYTNLPTRNNLV
jgi:cyclopropane fatty-acyl-phospholipid synthase-like methyltransferase